MSLTDREREFLAEFELVFGVERSQGLARCAICCGEKLPQFFDIGVDGLRYCRDHEACNLRAQRRLGVTDYKREPGRIGGREGKRRLAVCLAACAAYRATGNGREPEARDDPEPPTTVPVDPEQEPGQLEFECESS